LEEEINTILHHGLLLEPCK